MSDLEDIVGGAGTRAATGAVVPVPGGVAPTVVDDPDAGRRERNRKVTFAIVASLLTKPIGLLTPLVLVPLYLAYLGVERYGLFQAVAALTALLTLTNVGLNQGLINRLMEARAAGDAPRARQFVSSLLIVLAAWTAIALVVWTGIVLAVDWVAAFRVDEPRAVFEAPWVVWLTGALTLLGLLVAAPQAVMVAHQQVGWLAVWDAVTKVVVLAACVAVVFTPMGLIGVTAASAGLPVVLGIGVAVLIFRRWPDLRPSRRSFDWGAVRQTVGDGIYLFLIQASVIALFQFDKVLIGSLMGAEHVTPFALVGQVLVTCYAVFVHVLSPMWPAYGDAIRRGDWAWVRRTMRVSLVFGCGLVAAVGLAFVFTADVVLAKWSRGQVTHVSASLVLAVTATFLLRAWIDCRSVALNAAGVLAPQVILIVSHAVLNVVVAIVLGRRYGVEGVAWATPLTALVTTAWGYPWLVRKYLWRRAAVAVAAPPGGS
ncbi:MAG TPA: MATE family efflux transporter [Tepidisphaeraceae bacterium]|nr:MATE family efflux transporter [Tepidisphaeraceae bacterium]